MQYNMGNNHFETGTLYLGLASALKRFGTPSHPSEVEDAEMHPDFVAPDIGIWLLTDTNQ